MKQNGKQRNEQKHRENLLMEQARAQNGISEPSKFSCCNEFSECIKGHSKL